MGADAVSERVNYDCRPGDLIAFPDQGYARVESVYPDGVLVLFPEEVGSDTDARTVYYNYRSLRVWGVFYVERREERV